MSEPNPTRAPIEVGTPAQSSSRLERDRDWTLAAIPSEAAAVRKVMHASHPESKAATGYDPRLRPLGALLVALWLGGVSTVALIRQKRRSR